MNQIQALEEALHALRHFSELGNDRAGEAYGVLENLHGRMVYEKEYRKNLRKLKKLLKFKADDYGL